MASRFATLKESAAFDVGVTDGEKIGPKPMNPYQTDAEREAWETGYSVGVLNREAFPR